MKRINGKLSGHLASPEYGTTLAFRKDGSIQSAIIKASTKKTLTQTYQRLKMPNLGSFHKAAKVALRKAFEDSVVNTFAELVRYNITSDKKPVGITRQQKKAGACVVMPYQITDGELRPIVVSDRISDIAVNGLGEIAATTKIGDFAKAVVEANPGVFEYDDKLCFIEVRQLMNGSVPVASVGYAAVTLVQDSADTFGDLDIDLKGFSTDGGMLAVKGTPALGGFAWVHTRKDADGNMMLSKQFLVCNNDALIDRYTSPDALRTAAESYKVNIEQLAMLEPTTLKERNILKAFGLKAELATSAKAAEQLQIVGVEYNGKSYYVGDQAPVLDSSEADSITVQLSDISKLGNTIQCKINGSNVQSPTRDGNTITMPIPMDADGQQLMVVAIADPEHSVRLEF